MLVKGKRNARRVTASEIRRSNRKVMADEEFDDVDDVEVADVEVDPDASELLFEAQDVAELIAEVTEKPVEVTADEDTVVFSVDGTEFTVEADGAEEVLESRKVRGRSVKASRKVHCARRPAAQGAHAEGMPARRPVKAASAARTARTSKIARRSVKASTVERPARFERSARPARPAVTASRSVRRTARRAAR